MRVLFILFLCLGVSAQTLNPGNSFYVAGVLKPAAAGGGGTVTFDAVSSSTGNGVTADGSTLTTNQFTITVGGGLVNQYLVITVSIGFPVADVAKTVEVDGVTATSLGSQVVGGGAHGKQEMWGIKNLSSGSRTVVIRTTAVADGGYTIAAGAISFQRVDQTTPTANFTTASGDSTTPAVTVTSDANDMVVAGANGGSNFSAWQATDRWHNNYSTGTGGGCGGASSSSSSGSVAMQWTMGSDSWAVCGVSLNHD